MNNTQKITALVLAGLICFGIIGRFMHENSFEAQIARANKDCPLPVAGGNQGAITAIKLEDGYLTYYLSYDTESYNILQTLDADKAKEGLLMSFLCLNAQEGRQGDLIRDKLIAENCGLKIIVNCSAAGRFECAATPQDIKSLHQRFKLDPHEALYNLLSMSLEAEKANLPMQIDDGMSLTDFALEGENIVVTIRIDEKLYSLTDLADNKAVLKKVLLNEMLAAPETKPLLDMCKVSHTGLTFRFAGNRSAKHCDIAISSVEIRQSVKTPSTIK